MSPDSKPSTIEHTALPIEEAQIKHETILGILREMRFGEIRAATIMAIFSRHIGVENPIYFTALTRKTYDLYIQKNIDSINGRIRSLRTQLKQHGLDIFRIELQDNEGRNSPAYYLDFKKPEEVSPQGKNTYEIPESEDCGRIPTSFRIVSTQKPRWDIESLGEEPSLSPHKIRELQLSFLRTFASFITKKMLDKLTRDPLSILKEALDYKIQSSRENADPVGEEAKKFLVNLLLFQPLENLTALEKTKSVRSLTELTRIFPDKGIFIRVGAIHFSVPIPKQYYKGPDYPYQDEYNRFVEDPQAFLKPKARPEDAKNMLPLTT